MPLHDWYFSGLRCLRTRQERLYPNVGRCFSQRASCLVDREFLCHAKNADRLPLRAEAAFPVQTQAVTHLSKDAKICRNAYVHHAEVLPLGYIEQCKTTGEGRCSSYLSPLSAEDP